MELPIWRAVKSGLGSYTEVCEWTVDEIFKANAYLEYESDLERSINKIYEQDHKK